MLDRYQVFSFPGGFSYGDDTGSGKALANRIKNNLRRRDPALHRARHADAGNLQRLPGDGQHRHRPRALPGSPGRRKRPWSTTAPSGTSAGGWIWRSRARRPRCSRRGIERLHIPVAHGEGNFFALDGRAGGASRRSGLVAMRYAQPDGAPAGGEFPFNPERLHERYRVDLRQDRAGSWA